MVKGLKNRKKDTEQLTVAASHSLLWGAWPLCLRLAQGPWLFPGLTMHLANSGTHSCDCCPPESLGIE